MIQLTRKKMSGPVTFFIAGDDENSWNHASVLSEYRALSSFYDLCITGQTCVSFTHPSSNITVTNKGGRLYIQKPNEEQPRLVYVQELPLTHDETPPAVQATEEPAEEPAEDLIEEPAEELVEEPAEGHFTYRKKDFQKFVNDFKKSETAEEPSPFSAAFVPPQGDLPLDLPLPASELGLPEENAAESVKLASHQSLPPKEKEEDDEQQSVMGLPPPIEDKAWAYKILDAVDDIINDDCPDIDERNECVQEVFKDEDMYDLIVKYVKEAGDREEMVDQIIRFYAKLEADAADAVEPVVPQEPPFLSAADSSSARVPEFVAEQEPQEDILPQSETASGQEPIDVDANYSSSGYPESLLPAFGAAFDQPQADMPSNLPFLPESEIASGQEPIDVNYSSSAGDPESLLPENVRQSVIPDDIPVSASDNISALM